MITYIVSLREIPRLNMAIPRPVSDIIDMHPLTIGGILTSHLIEIMIKTTIIVLLKILVSFNISIKSPMIIITMII